MSDIAGPGRLLMSTREGMWDDGRIGCSAVPFMTDEGWLEMLEGVSPTVYPCRYPERRPYLKEWEKNLRVYLKSRRYLRRRSA